MNYIKDKNERNVKVVFPEERDVDPRNLAELYKLLKNIILKIKEDI